MPEQNFEPGNPKADRRLRAPETLGGTRKALRIGDRDQRPKDVDVECGGQVGSRRAMRDLRGIL
jgi:hypothetical protein